MVRQCWCGARWGIPKDEKFVQEALNYFLAYYREHKLDNTRLYDGVREALASIRQSRNGQPRKMAVLSNKPVNPSRAIIESLGLAEFFASFCLWRQQLSYQEA